MLHKGYEIVGYSQTEFYNRLDDNGRWQMELNTYGDNDYQEAYVILSPEQIKEEEEIGLDFTQLSKYDSIDEAKKEIDSILADSEKFINDHFIIGGIK